MVELQIALIYSINNTSLYIEIKTLQKSLWEYYPPEYNDSPLKRMTTHNRNRNHNDPNLSVGADFSINIPAAYSELPEGSRLTMLIKKSAAISRCQSPVTFPTVEYIENTDSRFDTNDNRSDILKSIYVTLKWYTVL